jgi:hypothetical protein
MNTAITRSAALVCAIWFTLSAAVAQVASSPGSATATPTAPPVSGGAPETAPATNDQAVPNMDGAADKGSAATTTCRTVKVTGSRVRTQRVCTTRDSERGSQDWLRDQQHRGSSEGRNGVNGGG